MINRVGKLDADMLDAELTKVPIPAQHEFGDCAPLPVVSASRTGQPSVQLAPGSRRDLALTDDTTTHGHIPTVSSRCETRTGFLGGNGGLRGVAVG